MSFSKYLTETTRLIEAPVTGDRIDLDINELFCIETEIAEHTDDSYVIHVDETAYTILDSLSLLEDEEEEVEETSDYDKTDGSPYDRGDADAYYGRRHDPHKYVSKADKSRDRVSLTDPEEIKAYTAGYHSGDSGKKDWGESKQPTNESLDIIRRLSGMKPALTEAITITHTAPKVETAKQEPVQENDDIEIWDRSMQQVADMAKHARNKEATERLLKVVEQAHALMKAGHAHDHIKKRVAECCKQHGVDHTNRHQSEIIRQIHNVINHYQPAKNITVTAIKEAEYQGHSVQLGKPTKGDVKKYKVFVKDPKTGNVKKVNFGDKNMEIKRDDPGHRKNFRARHNCASKKDRTTAGYWSCRMWSKKPVSKILKGK